MKPRCYIRKSPFKTDHQVEYGLRIATRDPDTGEVTSVVCCFCQAFGREDKAGQKRKPTQNIKYFKFPFRVDLYKQHVETQHPTKYREYAASSLERKRRFFRGHHIYAASVVPAMGNKAPRQSLQSPVAAAVAGAPRRSPDGGNNAEDSSIGEDELHFDVDAPVVEEFIHKLLFDPDVEQDLADRALTLFEPVLAGRPKKTPDEGGNGEGDANNDEEEDDIVAAVERKVVCYRVRIKNIKLFHFIKETVALGSSFRLAANQVSTAHSESALTYLQSACGDETKISMYTSAVIGSCLQTLSDILSETWAFSILFDSSTVLSTSYFDVRVQFVRGTSLYCFHMFCLPLFGRQSDAQMYQLFERIMEMICPTWGHRLLSTCSDSARNMTGRVRGIVTGAAARVETENCTLIRFWRVAHQLDILAQAIVDGYCNTEYKSTLTRVIGYLRRQKELIKEMDGKVCPKAKTTHWLSIARVLSWLAKNRTHIADYLEEKSAPCRPSQPWWIATLAVFPIIAEMETLYHALQDSSLTVFEQQADLAKFLRGLRDLTNVKGPLSETRVKGLVEEADNHCYSNASFFIDQVEVMEFIRGRGSFVSMAYQNDIMNTEKVAIVNAIGTLIVQLAQGVLSIEPEGDSSTNQRANLAQPQQQPQPEATSLPPYLPLQYATMLPCHFVDLVVRFRPRLVKMYLESNKNYIDELEAEQRDLRLAYQRESIFRTLLENGPPDHASVAEKFEVAWSSICPRFEKLCEFAGGMASVYPSAATTTASANSVRHRNSHKYTRHDEPDNEFSVIGWERDESRRTVLDMSLEAILHCRQYQPIQDLADEI